MVERLPTAGEKLPLLSEQRLPGGQVATALRAASALGLRCGLVAAVGDDEAGRLALAPLEGDAVDVSRVQTLSGVATRQAWVLVERGSGERTILERRDPRLLLPEAALAPRDVERTRLLLLDLEHPQAAQRAASHARRAGTPVILDADRATPAALEIARRVDFPIVSREFADEISGDGSLETALRGLFGQDTRMAVVTQGAGGSTALFDGHVIETPAPRVAVVDTTGAGDVFRGAFAWALLCGFDAERCLAEANAQAAQSCLGHGAQGALPNA